MDYTKESLYKAYAKHTKMGLDDLHMPGTDSMCAICDEIKQIDAAFIRNWPYRSKDKRAPQIPALLIKGF